MIRLLLLLWIAMCLVATLMLGVSSAFFPLTPRVIDTTIGAQVFQDRCAFCHSTSLPASHSFGPTLHNIGKLAGRRVPGISPEQYIYTSIVDPAAYRVPDSTGEMPQNVSRGLTHGQLLSLTAFLCTLEGRVQYGRILRLAHPMRQSKERRETLLNLDSVQRGQELFVGRLHCVSCHPLDEYPGHDLLAPSLLRAGRHSRDYLHDAIVQPNKMISKSYHQSILVRQGQLHQGRLLPARDATKRLLTMRADEGLSVHAFPDDELEALSDGSLVHSSDQSLMPSYAGSLSEDELDALLDFLLTLQ